MRRRNGPLRAGHFHHNTDWGDGATASRGDRGLRCGRMGQTILPQCLAGRRPGDLQEMPELPTLAHPSRLGHPAVRLPGARRPRDTNERPSCLDGRRGPGGGPPRPRGARQFLRHAIPGRVPATGCPASRGAGRICDLVERDRVLLAAGRVLRPGGVVRRSRSLVVPDRGRREGRTLDPEREPPPDRDCRALPRARDGRPA